MSIENEEIGDKVDRINLVLRHLISDLSMSRSHTSRFSAMSSMHSFTENAEEFDEVSSDLSMYDDVSQEKLFNVIQEYLIETDRLNMKIEDLIAEKIRNDDSSIELYLTVEQIATLNENLSKMLANSCESSVFILNKSTLISGNLQLASQNILEKLADLEIENINLRSKLLSASVEKSRRNENNPHISNEMIDIEIDKIEFAKKEQELFKAQEELGYKILQAKMTINEYKGKIEELKNTSANYQIINHHRAPSQEITRAKTPVSMLAPLSNSLITGLVINRQEIEAKIEIIENIIKKKYAKKRKVCKIEKKIENHDITKEFLERENNFKKKLEAIGDYSIKEKFILSYLAEQNTFFKKKTEELRRYEAYLQDTWINSNGGSTGIEAVKKAFNQNNLKSEELHQEREEINKKKLSLNKIKEIITAETNKLQDHRKKILFERKKLSKQQADITNFLKNFKNITKNI